MAAPEPIADTKSDIRETLNSSTLEEIIGSSYTSLELTDEGLVFKLISDLSFVLLTSFESFSSTTSVRINISSSPESIDLMTQSYTKDEYKNGFYTGWDTGFSLFILNEPYFDGSNAPKGIYRFAGYHNNHFWIDYENNLLSSFGDGCSP